MPAGSAVRNRSEIVTVATPRGQIEIARQETRGLRRESSWSWFWLARRRGSVDWREASTAREAIRRATLLPAGKSPAWLNEAAAEAERQLAAEENEETARTEAWGSPEDLERSATGENRA
jgi:hypothetical protein